MITPDQVQTFFQEVHGYPPFPWQLDLARVALEGEWPAAVDAPTGLGKTSAIDIAVLAMADAGLRGRQAAIYRRIFFVVDRRTVVDEAWEHAKKLQKALREAVPGSVVDHVADGLRALIGGPERSSNPLRVTRMRGGTTWDARWADRPDQPLVVLSTIDQVGSRVLFRGFGVTDARRPIDAAMVGCHSLLLLDEVHLAKPFAGLLGNIRATQSGSLDVVGLRTLSLSATPDANTQVMEFDEAAHLRDAEAARRLSGEKRLAVIETSPAQRYKTMVTAVRQLLDSRMARILVVCNTVAAARGVHSLLSSAGISAGLLTGRSRSFDKERVVDRWLPLLGMSAPADVSTVLVATQTVEVGVNLDVDCLITEGCGLNALVQRLGRLNRFGLRSGSAVVISAGADDPVYGPAAVETSDWLGERGAPVIQPRSIAGAGDSWLDVSPLALRKAIDETVSADDGFLSRANRPGAASPMVDSTLFDGWAQTSPVPLVDVPVEQYLHGLSRSDSTVTVVWRAEVWSGQELAVPVAAGETIDLPLASLRGWLADAGVGGVLDDLEGGTFEPEVFSSRRVHRVGPGNVMEWVSASAVRPGDTIVLRTSDGGLDEWGWSPESRREVLDVSSLVPRRGRILIRLSEPTIRPLVQGVRPADGYDEAAIISWRPAAAQLARLNETDDMSPGELGSELVKLAQALLEARTPAADPIMIGAIGHAADGPLASGRLDSGILVVTLDEAGDDFEARDTSSASDDQQLSTAMFGRRVTFETHSSAVARRAGEFARSLGLSTVLITAIERAGEWHDLGKLDPRFQAQLWGGVRPHSGVPILAKSGMEPRARLARQAARLARYPAGMRHEALSECLAAEKIASGNDGLGEVVDRELILHLIASHHGRSRPLLGTVSDPEPQLVQWDDGRGVIEVMSDPEDELVNVERFDQLNRKYGWWGLALLESIVRLADIACSSEGS